MLTAAVTGDVGAGKSTLSRVMGSVGANVISADDIAKSQWAKPDILARAAARWGSRVLRDGRADFAVVAGIAFSDGADDSELRFMNSLIHPGTRADIKRAVSSMRGLVVIEIPLLFESGGYEWIDYIIYASASANLRASRNAVRGWDANELSRRERFMMSSDEKISLSDIVLTNDGDMALWEEGARVLGGKLMEMAGVYELRTHCGSLENAEEIARALLEAKLVVCANMTEAASCYRWKGNLYGDNEWEMSCKTTERNLKEAMKRIRELHTYELPAITAAELAGSDWRTLEWVVNETK
ncbi:dephospho-CoA kinase [Synergistales bacterium]|nr:dephospho-CoA kinase [Synergistales bacterium]